MGRQIMSIKKFVFTVILTLLLSISFNGLGENQLILAASLEQRIIQTYGEAEIAAKPDLAKISIAVETKSKLANDAVEENSRIATMVINALLDFGLLENDIKTGSYRLHSYRELPRDNPNINEESIFYQAYNEIIVLTTQLDSVGELIDLAVISGANNINYISFELKNPQVLMVQALQMATEQAYLKAVSIAESAGETVKELYSIREEKTGYTPVRFGDTMIQREVALSAAPTPISPDDVTVRASVMAEFSLNN